MKTSETMTGKNAEDVGSGPSDAREAVRCARVKILAQARRGIEFETEPPIRVMARIAAAVEAECRARGLDERAIAAEVMNRTIGDVNARQMIECIGEPGGPGDFRSLADELGVALPGEEHAGYVATGATYRWLRSEMENEERALIAAGYDLHVYDINSIGNPVLRSRLAADLADWGIAASQEHVALGLGANDCIDKVLRGIAHAAALRGVPPGAVLFPAPGFNMPELQAKTFGFRLHRVETTRQSGFKLTPDQLDEALAANPDVALVYLVIVNNPTARGYTGDEPRALGAVLTGYRRRGHQVRLMSDLAYLGTGVPAEDVDRMAALSEFMDANILFFSLSKTVTLTGDRFGWVVFGDPELGVTVRSAWMNSVSTLPSEWQLRFMAYHRLFAQKPELSARVRALYGYRRAALRRQLEEFDSSSELLEEVCPDDGATIYLWCRLKPGVDCFTVFEKTGIAGIPGSTFGYSDEYVRFSVGMLPVSTEDLAPAVTHLRLNHSA